MSCRHSTAARTVRLRTENVDRSAYSTTHPRHVHVDRSAYSSPPPHRSRPICARSRPGRLLAHPSEVDRSTYSTHPLPLQPHRRLVGTQEANAARAPCAGSRPTDFLRRLLRRRRNHHPSVRPGSASPARAYERTRAVTPMHAPPSEHPRCPPAARYADHPTPGSRPRGPPPIHTGHPASRPPGIPTPPRSTAGRRGPGSDREVAAAPGPAPTPRRPRRRSGAPQASALTPRRAPRNSASGAR